MVKKIKILTLALFSALLTSAQCEIDTINPWFVNFQFEPTIECDDNLLDVFPQAYDNCDSIVDIAWYEEVTYGNCPSVWNITRYYRAYDDHGNQAVETQVIHIVDETPPTIIGETSIETPDSTDVSTTPFATAYDNCSSVTFTYTDMEISSDSINRLYIAIDDCGNISTFEQLLYVHQTPPDDDEDEDNGNNRVAICHRLGNGNWITIYVAPQAVPAHLGHGDYLGPCVEPNLMFPYTLEVQPNGVIKKSIQCK